MQIVYWIYRGLVGLIDEIRINTENIAFVGMNLHLLINRGMKIREDALSMESLA
tara:strand:- start:1291 stop:1452 length:162 start_codon:yes stop_codon:yes gene_type:complete